MNRNKHTGIGAMLAEVVNIVAADVLAQRVDQAAEWRRNAEARREAKDLAQAVDDWLAGKDGE